MGLDRVPEDPFDEATHRELDGRVVNTFQGLLGDVPVLTSPGERIMLLMSIINNSNGILDAKYDSQKQAGELIEINEELQELLCTAWQNKSFSEIRKLAILHHPSSIFLGCQPEPLSDAMMGSLQSALTGPYRGAAVDALYEYLEQNNQKFCNEAPAAYYARFCSIVQSSGTGKTRVMIELARKGVLVLYMNLRPAADAIGYPLRDDVPASILIDEVVSGDAYRLQCCAFFAAIFKLIADDLSDKIKNGESNAVQNWSNSMCDLASPFRAEFFNRLNRAYTKIKEELVGKRGGDQTADSMHASSSSLKDTKDAPGYRGSPSGVAEQKMREYYYGLTALFENAFPGVGGNKPKLVIALDEAHPLHESRTIRRATILFRVIKEYSESSMSRDAVWVVFASTTSKVAHFASPQALFDSARVSVGGELLFPPFSEMGWDQHAPKFESVPAPEVGKAKHILCYGRPLWVSLQGTTSLRSIFHLAAQKLLGASPSDLSDSRRLLAIIAQRFGLEVCFGHHEAVQYVEMSVASQCRVCITTTEDRLWSYTTYPSEPFLSCAAAFLLHKLLKNTLDTLVAKVDNGMIDIGQRGELVSRLLWLLAKDLFVLRDRDLGTNFTNGSDSEVELIHCKMIPVTDFLEFVFGKDFWPKASKNKAKEEFAGAYINFSHWVSMDVFIRRKESEDKKLDQLGLDEWTARHWQRTSAVQCSHNQPLIDKVIPIYFKPNDNRAECMSQMFISDKARATEEPGALRDIQRADPSIGGQGYSSDCPYIAILVDLRLDKTGVDSTFPTRALPRLGDARCLRIHASGFSTDTYPFLRGNEVIFNTLKHLVQKQVIPQSDQPIAQFMRDQVRYGSSAEVRHMKWERWSSATAETVLGDLQTQQRHRSPRKRPKLES